METNKQKRRHRGAFSVEKPSSYLLKQVGKEQNNQRNNQRQEVEKDFHVERTVGNLLCCFFNIHIKNRFSLG